MSTLIECSKATVQSSEKIINTANNIDVQIAIEFEEPWESIPLKSPLIFHQNYNFCPFLLKTR